MRVRTLLLAVLVLLGGVVGGTLLARGLSAAPAGGPPAQVVAGQFPLTFQGYLVEDDGLPVTDRVYAVTFTIYDSDRSGRVLWSELISVSTENGLFTAQLGEVEAIDPGTFTDNAETYLGIKVESSNEMKPRIRLAYVPYAISAITADTVKQPPPNANQIAIKRWYEAAESDVSFEVLDRPLAITFDGEGIWVSAIDEDDEDPDVVRKLSIVDGDVIKVVRVDENPTAIAYGGGEIWVANLDTDTIVKFEIDGTGKRTFDSKGDRPVDITFDGLNMWVVNQNSNNVVKFDTTNSNIFEVIPVGSSPAAVAFDGTNIWVTHSGSSNVTRINASSGNEVDRISAGVGREDIVFDGTHMWIVNENDDSVTKVRASDGGVVGTYEVGDRPVAAVFDGANLWVVNQIGDDVTKVRASDGTVLGSFPTGNMPVDIVFDGANVWVVNQTDSTVMRR